MANLLFISDDWIQKKPLKADLRTHGLTVTAITSTEFLDESFAPPKGLELLILDLERCQTDSLRLCRVIKRERPLQTLPLVLLMAEEQLGRLDPAHGFDDYLTLPVSGKRLAERIKFLLWKLQRVTVNHGFRAGELVIDFERYEVHVKGAPVDVTYKEFELLKFLVTHPGKAFTREVLLDHVWGYDYYGGTRTVDVHIRRLRAKIESGGAGYIDTVRNVGYKFLGPPGSTPDQ